MPDRINDVGVTGATCCAIWLQYSEAFNAGLTVLIGILSLTYVGLRVYREVQKIKFYKKKGRKNGKNR